MFPQFHLLLIPCQAEVTPDTKQGKVMGRFPPSLYMNELNSAEIERDSHGFWRDSFVFQLPLVSQTLNLAQARMPGSTWGSWHTICVTITAPSIHHVECKMLISTTIVMQCRNALQWWLKSNSPSVHQDSCILNFITTQLWPSSIHTAGRWSPNAKGLNTSSVWVATDQFDGTA